MLCEQLALLALGFGFILLGHFHPVKGNAVKIRVAFSVGMIADDERNLASQFAGVPSVEQVHQAMIIFGNEYRDAQPFTRKCDLPLDIHPLRNRREVASEIPHLDLESVEVPFGAREVKAQLRDHVLLEMKNISIRAVYEFCKRCIQTFSVCALHAKDRAIFHDFSLERIQNYNRRNPISFPFLFFTTYLWATHYIPRRRA